MDHDGTERERSWVDETSELLRLLCSTDIHELEIEHDGSRLLIRRDPTVPATPPTFENASPEPDVLAAPYVVTSPIVGVFRRTAGSKSEPPVEEGDGVTVGQAVGAVEAMRMINRVQSDHSGIVEKLLVQDGEPVEYGQPLMVLRPE